MSCCEQWRFIDPRGSAVPLMAWSYHHIITVVKWIALFA